MILRKQRRKPVCDTSATIVRATRVERAMASSSIWTPKATKSATSSDCSESNVSPFPQRGQRSGFVPLQTVTSKPLAAMHAAVSSTVITSAGANCVMKINSIDSPNLPKRCQISGVELARDLKLPDLPRRKVLATIVRLLERTFHTNRQRRVRAREQIIWFDDHEKSSCQRQRFAGALSIPR